jgi:hypothetical protein
MSDIERHEPEPEPISFGAVPKGYVALPFDGEQFKDFIRGLLGSPQSITKTISGTFEVTFDDLKNLHHLVLQRVAQQNESTLIQFTARLIFSDESSVELNSIDGLLTYNEIRPVVSRAIHLKWDFLVRFQDKNVPERQVIQVSIVTAGHAITVVDEDFPFFGPIHHAGFFSFRINHTARTWGADIEALLTNHIQSMLIQQPKIKQFIRKHSAPIGFTVGIFFFLTALVGSFLTTHSFSKERVNDINSYLATHSQQDIATLNEKFNHFMQNDVGGVWAQYYFALFVFLVLALAASIVLGVWSGTSADNEEPCFLLLTKESHKDKASKLKKLRKQWRLFVLSIIVSIISGVVANYIFAMLKGQM